MTYQQIKEKINNAHLDYINNKIGIAQWINTVNICTGEKDKKRGAYQMYSRLKAKSTRGME